MPVSFTQHLCINKEHVSAVYSEADFVVTDPMHAVGGSLIIVMNSGKEFNFKYSHHALASTSCMVLSLAIQLQTTAEIEI